DSISHIEFRRYVRGLPSPTDALVSLDRAIQSLVASRSAEITARSCTGRAMPVENDRVYSAVNHEHNPAELEEAVPLYIPVEHRGQSLRSYDLSVRLQ